MPNELLKIKPQEWEDAKAFFTATPQEIKFRKGKKLAHTHSFFHIERTLYAVNNTKNHPPEPDAGAGGFSRVKRAIDENKNCFVIKIEGPELIEDLTQSDELMKELGYMLSHRTKREVKKRLGETGFLQLASGKKISVEMKFYTVLKYLGDRDLFTELKDIPESKGITLSQDETLVLLLKAMMSVQRLHQKNIIHTDLKLENFVVNGHGEHRVVTVIDFDFSVKLLPKQYSVYKKHLTGTRAYLAPEINRFKEYSFKSDIYVFGYLLSGLNVNEKFYKELLFRLPENRPRLMSAVYNIVSHLEKRIDAPENSGVKKEISGAIRDFYTLARENGHHFLIPPPQTYLPRQITPLHIHVAPEEKTQTEATDGLLVTEIANMSLDPAEKCCIPCRVL